eukprot:CAMPEP_0196800934 /NCGR_PEP_ID=MMETSP1362-20130617/527_1 /TAXON_ID=163516 /ORGANISM="Leptocylindrus danicus, Strain CCMP1856" /LENGTH=94 /DNA_ID=CAMNT_0042171565 /DNA_START=405 /DNA_END=686 /DNA_ORIENTATION=-
MPSSDDEDGVPRTNGSNSSDGTTTTTTPKNRQKFVSVMRRNTLTTHQSNMVFEHYIAPAIQYPCTTQAIQSDDIDSLQSITLRPLLSKLGISST